MLHLLNILFLSLFMNNAQIATHNTEILDVNTKFVQYDGKIDKYTVTMFLCITQDKNISGFYMYKKYGEIILIQGSVDENFNASINQIDEKNNITAVFSGKMSKDMSFKGVWQTADKKKSLNFDLSQVRNNGKNFLLQTNLCTFYVNVSFKDTLIEKMNFVHYSLDFHDTLFTISDFQPSFDYSADLVLPNFLSNQTYNPKFQKNFHRYVFGSDSESIEMSFFKVLDNYFNFWYQDYNNYKDSLEFAFGLKYEFLNKINVRSLFDNIICFEGESYHYTGGTHGYENSFFSNFDLKTGDTQTINNIFLSDSIPKLSELIKSEIKAGNINYSSDDFFDFETIEATTNIALSDTAVIFVYNPYEIACYAMGIIHIEVDYNKLKQYLQPWFKKRMGIN